MCVDHIAAISTCMVDLSFMEDMQWQKNLVPTFVAYYGTVATKASIKKSGLHMGTDQGDAC